MDKLLSIVIAVYNVEQYIGKCLDSLIVSDDRMQKMEVLVINDGTQDNSAIIAKEYEKKYPQTFRVIDKKNGGPGSAWNIGVKESSGKYLRFLDSDDWLVNLSEFLDKLDNCHVDLVFTDWYDYNIQNEEMILRSLSSAMEQDVLYKVEDYDWKKTDILPNSTMLFNFHRCTYKTSILKEHQGIFVEGHMYADMPLQILPLRFSKSFVYLGIPLYCYLHGREGQSIDTTMRLKQLPSLLLGNKHIIDFYHSHPVDNKNVDDRLRYIIDEHTVRHLRYVRYLCFSEFSSIANDFLLWLTNNYPKLFRSKLWSNNFKLYRISPTAYWLLARLVMSIAKIRKLL